MLSLTSNYTFFKKLQVVGPLYKPFPGLLSLVRNMLDEGSGYGTHDFQFTANNKTVVTKEAYWTTAGLYGRNWGLAMYRILN